MEALSLYNKLMNEDPMCSMYAKLQNQQYYLQPAGASGSQVCMQPPAAMDVVKLGLVSWELVRRNFPCEFKLPKCFFTVHKKSSLIYKV